jgi:hypothetical protein
MSFRFKNGRLVRQEDFTYEKVYVKYTLLPPIRYRPAPIPVKIHTQLLNWKMNSSCLGLDNVLKGILGTVNDGCIGKIDEELMCEDLRMFIHISKCNQDIEIEKFAILLQGGMDYIEALEECLSVTNDYWDVDNIGYLKSHQEQRLFYKKGI